jgi:homoserine O-acetyltransferase/O-succinyltransferase
MDWQTSEETVPSAFVTEISARSLGAPPVTGAWRDGDHPGNRRFAQIGDLQLETGGVLPKARIAYETWGTPNADLSNAVLIIHSLTADSHLVGPAGPGHATDGWWNSVVGDGLAIDTSKWFVVCPNSLGGCQGFDRTVKRHERRSRVGFAIPVHHDSRPNTCSDEAR